MAADLTQTFMGKHVEKLVLAVAAAVFVGAVVWFVALREPQGRVRDEVTRLVETIKVDTQAPTLDKALTKEERVALGIDDPATTAPQFGERLNHLPPAWEPLVKMTPQKPTHEIKIEIEDVSPPDRILPVEDVEVAVGRGVVAGEIPNALAKLVAEKDKTFSDVVWVGCVGKIDLTEQLASFVKGNAQRQDIIISRVDLQRREILPDGTPGEWQDIKSAANAEVLSQIPARPKSEQDKRAVGQWYLGLKKFQVEVRRPPFHTMAATDPEYGRTTADIAGPITGAEQPSLTAPKVAPTKIEMAPAEGETKEGEPKEGEPKAGEAKAGEPKEAAPDAEKGTPAPPPPPPPPVKGAGHGTPDWIVDTAPTPKPVPGTHVGPAEAEHVYATVWANDDSVVPGKTYQYRMRAAVFNPVYSQAAVKDEKARWALDFPSEWSEPTDEVDVPPIVEFFFVGTFGERVNLELHRWIHGQWVIVPSAPSNLGAPVLYTKNGAKITTPVSGKEMTRDVDLSPQALPVDVIKAFPYQPAAGSKAISTNVLVFADPQGNLEQRIEWVDRERAAQARLDRKDVQPVVAKAPKTPPKGTKTTKSTKTTPTKASTKTTKTTTPKTKTPAKKTPTTTPAKKTQPKYY